MARDAPLGRNAKRLESLAGIEDVEFGRRHVDAGGPIVYLPEAQAIHWDHALDIRSYFQRTEFAAECAVELYRQHPTWPDCELRERINGPIHWGQEAPGPILKKG